MSKRFAAICTILAFLLLGAACGEDVTATVAPDTSPKASEPIVEVMPTAMATDPPTQTPLPTKTAPRPKATPNAVPPTPQPSEIAQSPPATPHSTPETTVSGKVPPLPIATRYSSPETKAPIRAAPTATATPESSTDTAVSSEAVPTPTKTPNPPSGTPNPTETVTPPAETPDSNPSWDDPLQTEITWVLESLNGSPIIEKTSIILTLYENSMGGHDGCNSYGFQSDSSPHFVPFLARPDGSLMEGEFSVRRIISTVALCPPIEGSGEQADEYYEALKVGKRFRIQNNRLEIFNGDGQVLLVFVRQPPLPGHQPDLSGTQWLLTDDEKSTIVAFLDDKIVAMVGECVHYAAGFRTTGRLLDLHYVLAHHFRLNCSERESIESLWDAEQYAVVEQEGVQPLLVGSRLGETLVLHALSSTDAGTNKGEWILASILYLTSDAIGDNYIKETIAGSRVTASLRENHVTGSAGCNSYQAPLQVTGENITISFPSVSDLPCAHLEFPERVMKQESRFLTLLPQITRGVTIADRLFLSTPTGIYLIFEAQ